MRQSCLRRRGSRGFSLIELLIVIAIILIILAIAVPKLGSAKMNANEMAVLREIQTITSMQTQYMSQFGTLRHHAGRARAARQRRTGASGRRSDSRQPRIRRQGRLYCSPWRRHPQGYTLNVNPKAYNSTGRRTFYTDQSMIIRQNWSAEPANASSPEFK